MLVHVMPLFLLHYRRIRCDVAFEWFLSPISDGE